MTRTTLAVLLPCVLAALTSCGGPPDLFHVETGGAQTVGATLNLCGTTSPLSRETDALVALRVVNCEGSGHLDIRTGSGSVVRCEIGYAAPPAPFGPNGFSHWFKIKDAACVEGNSILSTAGAAECGLRMIRRHVRTGGEVELVYFRDEQSSTAVDCINQWSERQLNG